MNRGSALPESVRRLAAACGLDPAGDAVLSRGGVPLLFVPVGPDRELTFAAAGLYRPQSAKARFATAAFAAVLKTRAGRFLPRMPGRGGNCGLLVCNPCHGTRIVAVRRTDRGHFEIVKAAIPRDAGPIRREHAALSRLKQYPGVPAVGQLRENGNAVRFSMPHLRHAPPGANPVPLLRAWETDELESAAKNGLIRDLMPFLDGKALADLGTIAVRRALVHGDFAPWNWRTDDSGNLACIDWEWAREDGFSGFDLVYCLVQQALLVKKVAPDRLLPVVQRAISKLGVERESSTDGTHLPLETLVSLVMAYRKTKNMDGQNDHVTGPESSRAGTGIALPNTMC